VVVVVVVVVVALVVVVVVVAMWLKYTAGRDINVLSTVLLYCTCLRSYYVAL